MTPVTKTIIALTSCARCGAAKGEACKTTEPSHRASKRRYRPGRPAYPHRERRNAYLLADRERILGSAGVHSAECSAGILTPCTCRVSQTKHALDLR